MLILDFKMQLLLIVLLVTHVTSFSLTAIDSIYRPAYGYQNSHDRSFRMSASPKDLTGTIVSEDLKGKLVAQRRIYRYSPAELTVRTIYTIEERQYYSVSKNRSLQPFGGKTIIYRGKYVEENESSNESSSEKNNSDIKLGPVVYSVKGLKDDDQGQKGDSIYAMALYCMEHPEILSGKGLEVGSGVGIGGILSVIGAGITSGSGGAAGFYASTPVPETLSHIIMTDSRENLLRQCPENLSETSFPSSNVQLGLLDWNKPVQNAIKNQCNFIIGCDCAHQYPSVNPLAKTLAYALKSSSTKEGGGKLLYIGPPNNEIIQDLQRELKLGYRINTSMSEIALDRIELIPQIVNSIDDNVQGENGGSVEHQKIDTGRYSAIVGFHHEEYDGTNGDVFFPAEGGVAIQEAAAQGESVAEKKQSASVDSDDSPVGTVNRGGSFPSNVSDDVARVRSIYLDWCKQYGKEPDEFRFSTFSFNFLAMESYAKENARNLQLNEYYDCTEEEYIALTIGKASEDSKKDNIAGNVKAKEGARVPEEKAEAEEEEALRMKEEGDRLSAVAAETARIKKDKEDAAEAARLEKEEERLAAEAARVEKEEEKRLVAEAARLEEEKRVAAEAAAETARLQKEDEKRLEAARLEKEEEEWLAAEAAAEATRLEKEKRLATEADAEAARFETEEEEEEEEKRVAAEAAAEAGRLEKEEAKRLTAEVAEAARFEKEEEERLAAEAAAKAARLEKEEEDQLTIDAARMNKKEEERLACEAAAEAARLKKEEAEKRLAAETVKLKKEEAEKRLAAEAARLEEERLAAEAARFKKEEEKRLAAEATRLKKEEEKRLAAEAAEAARLKKEEKERLAAEAARLKKEEEERLAGEAVEAARLKKEEKERLAAEAVEAVRLKEEEERLAAEAAEAARLKKEEEKRLAAEAAEAVRLKKEEEEERLAAEAAEAARLKKEEEEKRLAAEAAEVVRLKKEEEDRLAAEAAEAARLKKEEEEKRLASEAAEFVRLAKEEEERLASEAAEFARLAKEEEECLAAEATRLKKEEKECLAAEAARLKKEEKERLASEAAEAARLEKEEEEEKRLAAEAARLKREKEKCLAAEAARLKEEEERFAAEAARLDKKEGDRLADARIEKEAEKVCLADEASEAARLEKEKERLAAEERMRLEAAQAGGERMRIVVKDAANRKEKEEERMRLEVEEALQKKDVAVSAIKKKDPEVKQINFFQTVLNGLKSNVEKIVEETKDEIKQIPKKVKDAAIDSVAKVENEIETASKQVIEDVKAAPGRLAKGTKEAVTKSVQEVKSVPGKLAMETKEAVAKSVEKAKAVPGKLAIETKEAVKNTVEEVKATPDKLARGVIGAVSKTVDEVETKLEEAVENTAESISGAVDEAVAFPSKTIDRISNKIFPSEKKSGAPTKTDDVIPAASKAAPKEATPSQMPPADTSSNDVLQSLFRRKAAPPKKDSGKTTFFDATKRNTKSNLASSFSKPSKTKEIRPDTDSNPKPVDSKKLSFLGKPKSKSKVNLASPQPGSKQTTPKSTSKKSIPIPFFNKPNTKLDYGPNDGSKSGTPSSSNQLTPKPPPLPKQTSLDLFGDGAKKLVAKSVIKNASTSSLEESRGKSLNLFNKNNSPIILPKKKKSKAMPSQKRWAISSRSKNDGIPILTNWKQGTDGTVTGNISNSKMFRVGQKITTSPIKIGVKPGSIVTTVTGSKYRLSEQSEVKPSPSSSGPKANAFSLFNSSALKNKVKPNPPPTKKTAPAKKSPPVNNRRLKNDGIPILTNWKQKADGCIVGNVSDSKMFRNGEKITTSPVKKGAKAGTVVITKSGSKYRLK